MSIALIILSVCVWFFVGIRHFRIRIAKTCEVSRARTCIEVTEYRIVTFAGLHLRNFRVRIGDITESNRICWASLLARYLDVTIRDTNVIGSTCEALLLDLSRFNTLRAECALLHHTTHTHGDIWIRVHLLKLWLVDRTKRTLVEFADLTLVPVKEVKAAHLVRAIVRAIASAHAAVIRHRIQAL